ncbi:hypothetical protein C8R45DRAFT_1000359 [Mycena sanguinolenta]|nr:hypothetical protein C8R45DRAFT_1000359 [Mycena sanguinolenta]
MVGRFLLLFPPISHSCESLLEAPTRTRPVSAHHPVLKYCLDFISCTSVKLFYPQVYLKSRSRSFKSASTQVPQTSLGLQPHPPSRPQILNQGFNVTILRESEVPKSPWYSRNPAVSYYHIPLLPQP